MQALIIGSGGREHALAWKISQSTKVSKVFVAPGNAGTANAGNIENIDIAADNIEGLLTFAKQRQIDLTIVGPEGPLVAGIVDRFEAENMRIFGPRAAAAQLEGSKTFSKDFLAKHNIPTAAYRAFEHSDQAIAYIDSHCSFPIVIKADGLASGKGVVIASNRDEAIRTIKDMLDAEAFGEASARIVIEEFLVGEEASFICIVANQDIVPLATSQDHKAIGDGDTGLNTGGMGAYSPAPVVDLACAKRIMQEVILPTVHGLIADDCAFTGFLYAGIMVHPDGTPNVLEFNVRLGDPETQPIMARMQSDLFALLYDAAEGALGSPSLDWSDQVALGVVLAAENYPQSPLLGDTISGLDSISDDELVFHAGTKKHGEQVVTSGGRVLCVVATGDDTFEAQQAAYALADKIRWRGQYRRSDIGHRAISRKSK